MASTDLKFPVPAFNYTVNIFNSNAKFSEVSGLKITTEFKEVKAGGENQMLYKIPMRTSCGEVTLKRGVFKNSGKDELSTIEVVNLIKKSMNFQTPVISANKSSRTENITITLNDETGKKVAAWQLQKPVIVSYELSTLSGSSNEIAFETLVIAPAGLTIL